MIIYIFSARSDRSFNAFFIVFSSSWPLSGPCPWSRPRWLGPFAYLELGELVVWGYLGVPGTTLLHRRLSGSGKLTSCHQSILLQSCEPHANASSQFAFSFLILSIFVFDSIRQMQKVNLVLVGFFFPFSDFRFPFSVLRFRNVFGVIKAWQNIDATINKSF